jgi:hypothetical protein
LDSCFFDELNFVPLRLISYGEDHGQ